MRALNQMDTIQIELTSACVLQCANCTRFCGHHKKNFYLTEEQLIQALDSLEGFPNMVGFMGGEPLLHPKFADFCKIAIKKFPRERLGLWSTFPKGLDKYREVICETFGNVFLNDHTRDDIPHAPILVQAQEILKNRDDIFLIADRCWVQNSWSASINPKGAFFCEVAAAMSYLLDPDSKDQDKGKDGQADGWKVEKGWWKKVPKDYTSQIEKWCVQCGCALPLARRMSVDDRDDISPGMLEKLKAVGSKKLDKNLYVVNEFKMDTNLTQQMYPDQVYKDMDFRGGIAARYGIFLTQNPKGFLEPRLMSGTAGEWKKEVERIASKKPLFEMYKEKYNGKDVEVAADGVAKISATCKPNVQGIVDFLNV